MKHDISKVYALFKGVPFVRLEEVGYFCFQNCRRFANLHGVLDYSVLLEERTAHTNHAANHDDHEKLNAWFPYFYACMILLFMSLWGSALGPSGPLSSFNKNKRVFRLRLSYATFVARCSRQANIVYNSLF